MISNNCLLSLFSGTNDKAGGPHYMLKWASAQAVKQTFVPLRDVTYPYMKK
jgi:1-pyrroline-5-carboxylate dehydrogenase